MTSSTPSEMEIAISTLDFIPGREIQTHLGLVVGIGNVAFGNFTSNKAKKALKKALSSLQVQVNNKEADAVVGLQTSATSAGFPFFRPHTVILTGTAVKLR